MERFRRVGGGRWALAIAVCGILACYVLWPQVRGYLQSFEHEGSPSISPWQEMLRRPLARAAIWNSLKLSALSVLLAGAVGIGMALLTSLGRFPGRGLVMLGAALPLTLPPLVGVTAFVRLIGHGGLVPQVLARLFHQPPGEFVVLDLPAILLVHTYSFSTYFFLLTRSGLARLDRAQVLAARSLGAGRLRVLGTVILPELLPYLASAAILVFMASMGSFSAPLYLSSGKPAVPYLTLEIVAYAENLDRAGAAVLASLLSVLCLVPLLVLQLAFGRAWRGEDNARKGGGGEAGFRSVGGLIGRWALGVASVLFFLVQILPQATILATAFADMKAWNAARSVLPPVWTLENFQTVLARRVSFAHPITVSFVAAGLATILNVAFGVASALLMARGGRALRTGVDLASMLPLALPGTVIGFNLLLSFGGGSPLTAGVALRNTLAILVLVYWVRQIPLAIRPIGAAFARRDSSLEWAARSLGAKPLRAFATIVLPQIAQGVAAAALICFVTGAGEFVGSVLVASIRWTPISIEIARQMADSEGLGPASAYACLLMMMTAGAMGVYGALTSGRQKSEGGPPSLLRRLLTTPLAGRPRR